MPKKEFISIIKKRQELIKDVPSEFIKKLGQIQNALYRELLYFVKELDTKGKHLEVSRYNIARANKLRYEIRQWLDKAGYYEQVNVYGSKYGEIINLAKRYYKEMGYNPEFFDRDIETLSRIRKNDLNFLKSQEQNVIDTTYSTVMDAIYGKGDWQLLAERLKTLHTDTVYENGKTLKGLLKKYASTYANTAFAAFDRRVQNIKAQQYSIELFLYSGGTITDTREFCAQRVNKVFTKKEIDGWNNMQWNGKIRGADVWAFLGGYNCQHILTPITEELARSEYGYGGEKDSSPEGTSAGKEKSEEERSREEFHRLIEEMKKKNENSALEEKSKSSKIDKAENFQSLIGLDEETAKIKIEEQLKKIIEEKDFEIYGFHSTNDDFDFNDQITSFVWKERDDGDFEKTNKKGESLSCSKINDIGKKQHFPNIFDVDYRYGFYEGKYTYVIGGSKSELAEWQVDDNEIAIKGAKILFKFLKE